MRRELVCLFAAAALASACGDDGGDVSADRPGDGVNVDDLIEGGSDVGDANDIAANARDAAREAGVESGTAGTASLRSEGLVVDFDGSCQIDEERRFVTFSGDGTAPGIGALRLEVLAQGDGGGVTVYEGTATETVGERVVSTIDTGSRSFADGTFTMEAPTAGPDGRPTGSTMTVEVSC
ncbi:MAG: hypothetical protein ACLGIC_04075 [Acidimicrobiia bacterium]